MMLAGILAAGLAVEPPAKSNVEFRWDAPAECPSEAEVIGQLERLLGGPVSEQGERRLTAIARVRQESDGRWDLRLWTVAEEETSQRSMSGEDCVVLAEAAALLAAMAIDPSVLARGEASPEAVEQAEQAETVEGGESAPEQEPEPEVEAPPPEPLPPLPEPNAPWKRRFIVGIGASTGISYGDLPGVGPIVRLGVAMQWSHARVEIEGHYAFLRRARFEDGDMVGADLRHGMVVARGCGVLHARGPKLEFPICGGLEGGVLAGRGVGFTVIENGRIPWAAIDVSVGLAWAPIRRLAIGLRVEPWVALLRGRFTADDSTQLWRPLPLGVRAVAGLEVRF